MKMCEIVVRLGAKGRVRDYGIMPIELADIGSY